MDDTISRHAAIKAVEDLQDCYNGFSDTYDKACIIGVLEELPSAEPERKTGRWIDAQYPFSKCDQCGAYMDTVNNEANYCCVCGAKMEVEHD